MSQAAAGVPGAVDHILGFVSLLRTEGISVSPPEVVDVLGALATAPEMIDRRETFAAVLSSTLVKRASDLPAFRRLFALYFAPPGTDNDDEEGYHHHHDDEATALVGLDLVVNEESSLAAGPPRHEHGTRIDLRRYFGEGNARPGHDHHGGDRLRLTWMGRELAFDPAGSAPPTGLDGGIGLRRVTTTGRPGALQAGASIQLPRDIAFRGGGGGSEWDGDLQRDLASLLRRASPPVQRSSQETRPSAYQRWSGDDGLTVPDLGWDYLTVSDLARLDRAMVRLGRVLGGAPGRRRPCRAGALDARRTARSAAATGGVPFAPVYRRRRDDRARLIVICDASLSVRGAARFLLAVARSAQRGGGRVRSFVFVRDVADATAALDQPRLEAAIEAVFGGRVLDTAEASDGGAALETFLDRFGDQATRRTTLLILGDGRNNGHEPNVSALAELKRRCRRVVWLTPEEPGSWQLGGCDLPRYAVHCDLVATVRSPGDLERVVAKLAL